MLNQSFRAVPAGESEATDILVSNVARPWVTTRVPAEHTRSRTCLQRASMDVLRFTARRLWKRHRRVFRLSTRALFAALLVLSFLATQMFLINLPVRPSAGVTRRVTPALAAAAPASAAPAVVTSETVVWTQKPEMDSSLAAEVQVLSGHYAECLATRPLRAGCCAECVATPALRAYSSNPSIRSELLRTPYITQRSNRCVRLHSVWNP